ncbi:DUF488 domain-containing protein [Craurococcus roseus]|uniref:DUF488 domain-containing protein n=1 Tax=Craurococcus roseus TaxID=77585 RepID=A0ABN1FHQ9_9PROT
MTPAVFTIGYERATPSSLLAALRAAGVRRVVDVRALANSRRPGFAKRALSAALEEAGIGYLHLPALGTPPEGREAVRAGRPEEMRRIFARRLAGTEAQAALADLTDRAAREPVCLLCLEADPRNCHRTLVAEAVAARAGGAIDHLHLGEPDADLPRPA